MNLIKPSFDIIEQEAGLVGIYKMIELAGRTCYKSEKYITPDSANKFAQRMIESGHHAMLEHGTVYLDIHINNPLYEEFKTKYSKNPYSRVVEGSFYPTSNDHLYITTNLRVLVENDWMEDIEYMTTDIENHAKRHTVRFICDRGVSHEFVRHRVMSFAQESTRYCNYNKEKFGNELTFILPPWVDQAQLGHHDANVICGQLVNIQNVGFAEGEFEEIMFLGSLAMSEISYNQLINKGWKAQEARAVLPTAIKTEIVMTGFEDQWQHFFDLRSLGLTGAPHPQAKELADPLMDEFIDRGWISDELRYDYEESYS